jgi:hypothetical protein
MVLVDTGTFLSVGSPGAHRRSMLLEVGAPVLVGLGAGLGAAVALAFCATASMSTPACSPAPCSTCPPP